MICTARRSNGEPCKASAIRGGTVCVTHGGSAPHVREAAKRRLLALVDPALAVLARAVRPRRGKALAAWEPTATEIRAVTEILNRTGFGSASDATPDDDGKVTWEEFVRVYRKRDKGEDGPD